MRGGREVLCIKQYKKLGKTYTNDQLWKQPFSDMTFATSWLIQNYKYRLSVSSVLSITTSKCSSPAPGERPGQEETVIVPNVICNRWTPRQTYEPQHDIFRLSVSSLVSITTSKCSPAAPAVGPGQEETVIVPMSEVREISLPDSACCCLLGFVGFAMGIIKQQ